MSRMLTAKSLRHEDVHRFSDKLLASIAKQLFDLTVYQDHAALIVHEEDAARRSLRRETKSLLRSLSLCHIDRNTPEDSFSVRSSHMASAQFGPVFTAVRKFNPIFAIVIFTGSNRVHQYPPESIAISDMHSKKNVFQLDFSSTRQPQENTAR